MDFELPDDHPGDRQLLLILVRDPGLHDRARTGRTLPRQRGLMRLVDRARDAPTGLRAIGRARLPPGTFRMLLEGLRKRRGLPKPRPSGLVELPFQMIDLLLQPLALALPARPVAPAGGLVPAAACPARAPRARPVHAIPGRSTARLRVGRLPRIRHALVMPESPRRTRPANQIQYGKSATGRGNQPHVRLPCPGPRPP